MQVYSILGSPHKNGNTARVLDWVEDELRTAGHKVERAFVGDGRIGPCRGCHACKETLDKPGCVGGDGANDIFARMLVSDIVILAAPLYCWGVSAQLKCLIDRAYCLLKEEPQHRSLLTGQRFALLVTGGGPIKDNLEFAVPSFRAFVEFFECRNAGTLLVPDCTEPDKLGAEREKEARAFARALPTNGAKSPL